LIDNEDDASRPQDRLYPVDDRVLGLLFHFFRESALCASGQQFLGAMMEELEEILPLGHWSRTLARSGRVDKPEDPPYNLLTMREDKKTTQEDIDRTQVRLVPFLGIEPGHWLAGFYAFGIAALLFAFLLLPGIVKNGSLLIVDSKPRGSAVFLDGAHVGATPCEVFAARGDHLIVVSRPSFISTERRIAVGGRLFGSIMFPRRQKIDATLSTADSLQAIRRAFADYSAWSLAGRPSATYQYPLVLSESILALSETGNTAALPRSDLPALISSALASAPGEHAARDAIRASFLAAAGGAPSPLGLVAGLEALAEAVGNNPAIGPWLEIVLPQTARERLVNMDGVAALRRRNEAPAIRSSTATAVAGTPLRIGGIEFRPVPAGDMIAKGETPEGVSVPYKTDMLIAAGKADAAYLADWNDAMNQDLPVTGISWKAASAFCTWLSSRAPDGYTVELPSETMWERAAFLGTDSGSATLFAPDRRGPTPVASNRRDRLGIADMLGNVWEWCSDSYLAVPALSPGMPVWNGTEKTVRGGSWANRPGSVSLSSRGSFQPSFSSPFLGFRPALIHR
jgi:iron(II)-dependent oxidoreductase